MLFGAIVAAIADWYKMAKYSAGCGFDEPTYPERVHATFDWTLTDRAKPHVWADRMVSGLAYV